MVILVASKAPILIPETLCLGNVQTLQLNSNWHVSAFSDIKPNSSTSVKLPEETYLLENKVILRFSFQNLLSYQQYYILVCIALHTSSWLINCMYIYIC